MIINDNSVEQINVALLDIDKRIKALNADSETLKSLQDSVKLIKSSLNETKAGLTGGATYDINISGNAATATQATNAISAIRASTAESADEADHAVLANTADSAKTANHAGTADSATTATQDASGNVITATYATKTELEGFIKFKTVTVGDITIPSNNYLEIDVGLTASDTIISAKLPSWSSNSGSFSIICYRQNRVYIVGNAGTTITNVSVQAIYI